MEAVVLGEFGMEGEPEDVPLLNGYGFPLVGAQHRDALPDPDDTGGSYEDCAKRPGAAGETVKGRWGEEGLEAENLPPVSIPVNIHIQEFQGRSCLPVDPFRQQDEACAGRQHG